MEHSSVIGLFVYCKNCSHRFQLGPLDARAIRLPAAEHAEPYEMGWLCRCDHCSKEFTYQRADFTGAPAA
jgi:hypothetical protein